MTPDCDAEPRGVDEEQDGGEEEHVADTDCRDETAADESARKHADKLEGLVKSVYTPETFRRRQNADECVDGRDESRHGDTVNETQNGKLPR